MKEIVNSQKGSNNNQIGEQNNTTVNIQSNSTIYTGASLEEVSSLVTNLFLDNFPRMQQIAKEVAESRVNELLETTIKKIEKNKITDLSPFMDVDVQYVLYEAQKNYARFATEDLLDNLSSLIVERVKYNDGDLCLKVAIDKAISVISMISVEQLDYLTLLFLVSNVKFENIKTLDDLKLLFEYLDNIFPNAQKANWQHLNVLGCLQINLINVCKHNAETYGFKFEEVKSICPKNISDLTGDYSTSPIGTIIAIIYAEQKTNAKFNPRIWIHN